MSELPVPVGVQAQSWVVESEDPQSNPNCPAPQRCAWGPALSCWDPELLYLYGGIILSIINVLAMVNHRMAGKLPV